MAGTYTDFIPEGADQGGLGNGFTDFVPTPQPQRQPEAPQPEPEETPVDNAQKKIDALAKAREAKKRKADERT